jgi:putative NIF3 family GTP cyclohydrolase 1 type 2
MKNHEVLETIIADDPMWVCPPNRVPLDVFKYGDPNAECKGIAVTVAASINAIHKAAEEGCNLIIAHENAFYTDTDETQWLKGNEVFEEKAALMDKYGIALCRYHDHMHHHKPDKMYAGVAVELGWQDYYIGSGSPNGSILHTFMLPEKIKLKDLAQEVKEKFALNGLRVIGNMDAEVQKVGIINHIFFALISGDKTMSIEKNHTVDIWQCEVDVVISAETLDWTALSYIRDAAELGLPLGVLAVGHFNRERLGMRNMANTWLPKLINNAVPVKYVETGDMFQFIY